MNLTDLKKEEGNSISYVVNQNDLNMHNYKWHNIFMCICLTWDEKIDFPNIF